jgi:hypothetical protein
MTRHLRHEVRTILTDATCYTGLRSREKLAVLADIVDEAYGKDAALARACDAAPRRGPSYLVAPPEEEAHQLRADLTGQVVRPARGGVFIPKASASDRQRDPERVRARVDEMDRHRLPSEDDADRTARSGDVMIAPDRAASVRAYVEAARRRWPEANITAAAGFEHLLKPAAVRAKDSRSMTDAAAFAAAAARETGAC